MQPALDHDYRIAPELRRCCWYAIFGTFIVAAAGYFAHHRNPVAIWALPTLCTAAMAVPLRWKLRVDRHGISRRRLFHWDLWSWTDLASGRIFKSHPFTLHDPERPWLRRRLPMDTMASDDIQEVFSMINAHYKLPPPPTIPDTLTIKYKYRCSATFDSNGICLIIRGMPRDYRWDDLCDIRIIRMEPLSRNFKRLVMTLPDQEITLRFASHQGSTSPTWRGATSEEINEFLFQFAPADRIHVSIAPPPPLLGVSFTGQQLTQRKHIEQRLKEVKIQIRANLISMAVAIPLLLSLLIWIAMDRGFFVAMTMSVIFVLLLGPIVIFFYHLYRNAVSKLTELLEQSSDAEPRA